MRRRMRRRRKALLHHQHTQAHSRQDMLMTATSFHSISTPAAPPRCAGSAGTRNATTHTHTHIYTQSYPGLHRPPSCLAELPVYAKDNWPNGLSLPLWLNMERGSRSPPASEYWLVALLVIWLFEQSSPSDPRLRTRKWAFNACNLNTSVRCGVYVALCVMCLLCIHVGSLWKCCDWGVVWSCSARVIATGWQAIMGIISVWFWAGAEWYVRSGCCCNKSSVIAVI